MNTLMQHPITSQPTLDSGQLQSQAFPVDSLPRQIRI